ncbi:MAG: CCA tRNA nucleotidyltransferase [Victivallales bacterium]|nr:CCA tRNA nucleotidyltransferase [Victivallales bacterium]
MHITEKTLLSIAKKIVKKLQDNGYSAFYVGGCVRDKLLGKHVQDVDIATSALPVQVQNLFKRTYNIGAAFGIINVVEHSINFEVATYRTEGEYKDGRRPHFIKYTESPEEDAGRRDFSINALFYDPSENKIYDFFNGINDLELGLIKCIGNTEKRLLEDYLRMIRAVRFGARYNFVIDPAIIRTVKKYSSRLKNISNERIREELNKIFSGPNPDRALQLLSDTGILEVILPELELLKGIRQPENFHPEGDVFEHTKLMLAGMVAPTPELAWSVLLHDVGKASTMHIDKTGKPCFHCHDARGTEIAGYVLKRFRFSNESIRRICTAVKNHMKFANAAKMKTSKIQRMMTAKTFPMELELHRLDVYSSNKKFDSYLFFLDKIIEYKCRPEMPKPLLNGNDLKAIGFKTGPLIGKILSDIEEKQLSGEINSKSAALNYIKKIYLYSSPETKITIQ